jgi:hypothetical protein
MEMKTSQQQVVGKRRRRYRSIWDISRDESMALLRELFARYGPEPFDREELLATMRDFYRLGALGKQIRKELSGDIRAAVLRGILDNTGGRFSLLCRHIGQYDRDLIREQFLAAIGWGWIDRDDAIRQAVRYLGFRRTGSVIRQAFRSAINSAFRCGELKRDGGMVRRP